MIPLQGPPPPRVDKDASILASASDRNLTCSCLLGSTWPTIRIESGRFHNMLCYALEEKPICWL